MKQEFEVKYSKLPDKPQIIFSDGYYYFNESDANHIVSTHPGKVFIEMEEICPYCQGKIIFIHVRNSACGECGRTMDEESTPILQPRLQNGCVILIRDEVETLVNYLNVFKSDKVTVKYNTCIKPNCKCAEIEMEKQGTENIKSYPCLADMSKDIESLKTTPTQEQIDVDKAAKELYPIKLELKEIIGYNKKVRIDVNKVQRDIWIDGASWQQSHPPVTSMSGFLNITPTFLLIRVDGVMRIWRLL